MQAPEADQSRTHEQRITIRITEDDHPSRTLLATCLKRGGYAVIETERRDEAVRLALEHLPALAILDIMMPGLNGAETAAALQRETDVPFMFLSALNEGNIVRRAIEGGALGYLVKPINVAQLPPSVPAALVRAQELCYLRTAERNLSTALSIGRETRVAVGILMERHKLTRARAFELLRVASRSQRRRAADLAAMIAEATETLKGLISNPGQTR